MESEARQPGLCTPEAEILRLVKLASETKDLRQQEQYWAFTKDLQTEAREIRSALRRQGE